MPHLKVAHPYICLIAAAVEVFQRHGGKTVGCEQRCAVLHQTPTPTPHVQHTGEGSGA